MELIKANVYTSEDINVCDKDINKERRIGVKDAIHYMERNPQYASSQALHKALALAIKNT